MNSAGFSPRNAGDPPSPVQVTVIVTSYNNGRYIGETIASVLAQEGAGFELIVSDDCSTDDSLAVIRSFAADARLTVVAQPRNLGAIGNFNDSIGRGSGRYVMVLGSDDVLYPGYLQTLVSQLDAHPEASLGYSQCHWIDEHGTVLSLADHPGHLPQSYAGGRDEVVALLSHDNYITPSCAMLRRSVLDTVRRADGLVHHPDMLAGDWELYIRVARAVPDVVFVREPLVGYRIHSGQISQKFYGSEKPLSEHAEILEANLADDAVRPRLVAHADAVWGLFERRLKAYPPAVQDRYRDQADRLRIGLFAPARRPVAEPLFTVVVTTFNRPELLVHALRSLENQTLQDFEVVLVNDHGAPVEAEALAWRFPLAYLRLGRNSGLPAARNAGIRIARGRYLCYLDDDDIYLPEHLQTLADAHAARPDAVAYTNVVYVQERVQGGQRTEVGRHAPFVHTEFSKENLFVRNYLPVNTWSHPRSAVERIGYFDESLTALEDWDFLLRLAAHYAFQCRGAVTAEVHMRVESGAGDHMQDREQRALPALYRLLYRRHGHLDQPALRTAQLSMLDHLDTVADEARQRARATPLHQLDAWVNRRVPLTFQGRQIDRRLAEHGGGPVIGILMRDPGADRERLLATLESLRFGTCLYDNVRVYVLTSQPAPPTSPDSKVQFVQADGEGAVHAVNLLVAQGACAWWMLCDAGDRFSRAGLLMAALHIVGAPDCRALMADEIRRLADGGLGAAFRPDVSLDYLLSFPATMARHWLVRGTEWLLAGGFDPALPEALEFDLLLRLIDRGGMAGLDAVHEPLLTADAPVLVDNPQEEAALLRHLQGRGYPDAAVHRLQPRRYRIDYRHAARPLVSVLLPVHGATLAQLQRCMETLLEKTGYADYEVLIVAGPAPGAEVQAWLAQIEAWQSPQMRVVRHAQASARAAAVAAALADARGEYVVTVEGATAFVRDDWMQCMLNHAQRPEVAVVGAKLLRPDGTVEHAGLVLGLRGAAGSPFVGEPLDAVGYMHRLEVDQNYSAVSGACMMVRRAVLQEVAGSGLPWTDALHQDVELCLRVRAAGYLVVWTPHAVALHEEMAEAQAPLAMQGEAEAFHAAWLPVLARDPAYNPNLELDGTGFTVDADLSVNWQPLAWHPLPRAVVHPADAFGCGHYRMIQPFQALRDAGMVDGMLSQRFMAPVQLERCAPDVLVFQRQIDDIQIENMRRVGALSRAFKIYELDDYLPNLPVRSVHKRDMPADVVRSLRRGVSLADRFVVSTEALAEAFDGMHPDIHVVHNRLPVPWWSGLQALRRQGRKPRVGWAGGMGHTGDLELVADVVAALAQEVDWVFFGMCPEKIRPFVHEVRAGVPIEHYPAALAALNLDLAIAPVEHNLFNECKSNLRLLEYGACGIPVVCSDVRCYQGSLPVTRVKNRFRDWVDAIRAHVQDLDAAALQGDRLRQAVLADWMLEGAGLEAWRQAWLVR